MDGAQVGYDLAEIAVELVIDSNDPCVKSGYVPSEGVDNVSLFGFHIESSRETESFGKISLKCSTIVVRVILPVWVVRMVDDCTDICGCCWWLFWVRVESFRLVSCSLKTRCALWS